MCRFVRFHHSVFSFPISYLLYYLRIQRVRTAGFKTSGILLLSFIVFFSAAVASFPVGVNLPVIGNSYVGFSGTYSDFNWNSLTGIFTNIFKHCGQPYVRYTSNGGSSFGYYTNFQVSWRQDGYPSYLPYTNKNNYWATLCDIGVGANFTANGNYSVFWEGSGDVGFPKSSVTVYSYSNSTNTASINIHVPAKSTSGLTVWIFRSRANNPVRNVRIVPTALANSYQQQVFLPAFVQALQGFQLIRFTGWQKLSNSAGKRWVNRTLPSSFSQNTIDGVAIEHMLDLVRLTGVKSVWFSFPMLSSADYNLKMITMLQANLPPKTTIYYEAGCPEVQGTIWNSNRAPDSFALYDLFANVFQGSLSNFTLVPTYSITNPQYVSFAVSSLGSGINRVKAFAIPATFGSSPTGGSEWDIAYARYSDSNLLQEVRRSVLRAEVVLNTMTQLLLAYNPVANIVGYTGGPYLSTYTYGYRAANYSIMNCAKRNQFPCSWSNVGLSAANQAAVNAFSSALSTNASLEKLLEDKLIAIQRNSAIQDIFLDHLERWRRLGGGLFIGSSLVQPVQRCPTGGHNCGNNGMLEAPLFQPAQLAASPRYYSLVQYSTGVRSSLPFTSADIVSGATPAPSTATTCVWGTRYQGTCVCFAGYAGSSCSNRVRKPNDCTNDTGINLAGIADWSSEWVYVDLFRSSRAWISQNFFWNTPWSTGVYQNLSVNDYPRALLPNQKLGAMMIRDLQGHMRSGRFVCLYDGDGIITFSMDIDQNTIVRDVGRIEVTITPSTGLNNGAFLMIERTNPLDPIRNIRFIMPGFESTYSVFPFHPLYLDSLKNYKVLRFMDLANTNGVMKGNWTDRTTKATRSYSNTIPGTMGMPIEDMVLLANTVGASPWFNMPHLCTDDFVRRFAQLVLATLRPDVKIYIEYSNEVWGTLFNGGQYAQVQGLRRGFSTDATKARFCFYVYRSSQIFAIWKSVFAAAQQQDRLEFVYSSQAVQPYVTQLFLQYATTLKVSPLATAIAIAPYFGTYTPSRDKNLGVFLNTTLPAQIASMTTGVQGHLSWAKKFNMTLVTYESGIGLAGSGSSSDLAIQANRDPRMTGIYVKYFNMLRSAGVRLMMQFTSCGLFSTSMAWGLLEYSDQNPLASPKYLGLQAYVASHRTCDISTVPSPSYNCSSGCSTSGLCTGQNKCECYYGAKGSQCQNTTYTEHTDLCGYFCNFAQGTCVQDYIVGNDRYWKCQCLSGYYGAQCSLFNCPNSCNYNGQCIDANVCSCYPGYGGTNCDVDCGCNGHGSCIAASAVGAPTCLCDAGFVWSNNKCVAECSSGSCAGPWDSTCALPCKYGQCQDGSCRCWAGASGALCDVLTPSTRPNAQSQVGSNLNGISYYDSEWVFVDVMKMSSAWVSLDQPGLLPVNGPWGNGMAINLRRDGYPAYLLPGQILVKLMLRDLQRHAPAGRYVCLYDGDGVISFDFDAKVTLLGKGRVEFDFTPTFVDGCYAAYCSDNGIALKLLSTNPANPVRNIRVIMPGFESTHVKNPFHPWFLKNIARYSVLRFMDWQTGGDVAWVNRTLPSFATQANGVALEHMIHLCNLIGASPWFSLPYAATDDYILQFAQMVKATLRPDVPIYLEYSNEVWNGLFPQGTYAQKQGLLLKLSTDPFTAQIRFYSERAVQIFTIWKNVFRAVSPSVKVNYVMSVFTASPFWSEKMLTWKKAYLNVTAVGVAPYFDCGVGSASDAPLTALLSVSQLLSKCSSSLRNVSTGISAIGAVANKYSLPMVTYESGQSLVEYNVMAYGNGETPGLTSLFWAANRDPGMQSVYLQYINVLKQTGLIGVHPMIHFLSAGLWSKYGSWGAIEYTGQPISKSPKYLALRTLFSNTTSASSSGVGSAGLYFGNPFTFGLGLDVSDFSYAGFPAVLSPRNGDVWVTGPSSQHSVRWDTKGCDPKFAVSIFLWRIDGNTNAAALAVSGAIKQVQHCLGQAVHTLPSNLVVNGSAQFFYEIRDATGGSAASNYSSIFALKSPYAFAPDISYACCQGDLFPVVSAAPPVPTCYAAAGQEYANALQSNSTWTATSTYLRLLSSPPSLTCSASAAGSAAWSWYSCDVDTSTGCRSYRVTLKINSNIPGDHRKPIMDCVAQVSPFSRLNASAVSLNLPQVNVPYVTPTSNANCLATNRTDYSVQRGACSGKFYFRPVTMSVIPYSLFTIHSLLFSRNNGCHMLGPLCYYRIAVHCSDV